MKSTLSRPLLPISLDSDADIPTPALKGFENLAVTDRAAREEISHRAYSIWECAGRPENRELANWLEAEAEVLGET
jgi:Protein of unknown function (DUF2934)